MQNRSTPRHCRDGFQFQMEQCSNTDADANYNRLRKQQIYTKDPPSAAYMDMETKKIRTKWPRTRYIDQIAQTSLLILCTSSVPMVPSFFPNLLREPYQYDRRSCFFH